MLDDYFNNDSAFIRWDDILDGVRTHPSPFCETVQTQKKAEVVNWISNNNSFSSLYFNYPKYNYSTIFLYQGPNPSSRKKIDSSLIVSLKLNSPPSIHTSDLSILITTYVERVIHALYGGAEVPHWLEADCNNKSLKRVANLMNIFWNRPSKDGWSYIFINIYNSNSKKWGRFNKPQSVSKRPISFRFSSFLFNTLHSIWILLISFKSSTFNLGEIFIVLKLRGKKPSDGRSRSWSWLDCSEEAFSTQFAESIKGIDWVAWSFPSLIPVLFSDQDLIGCVGSFFSFRRKPTRSHRRQHRTSPVLDLCVGNLLAILQETTTTEVSNPFM